MTTENQSVTCSGHSPEVAATGQHDQSLLEAMKGFQNGSLSLEELAIALKGEATPKPKPSPGIRPEKFRFRNSDLTLSEYISQYRQEYQGRDPSRENHLKFWDDHLGQVKLADLDDDDIARALDDLANENGRAWRGKDADGKAIIKLKPTKRSPATVNRYRATLSAVCSWAIKTVRSCPKSWGNPCSRVSSKPENNLRVRYLTPTEQQKLLDAAKKENWERMYLLVLMALKTGARRSELTGLRWRDIDWERQTAHLLETKNGEQRYLPLLTDVIKELKLHRDKPETLIFASRRTPSQPMAFETIWQRCLKNAGIQNFKFHDLRHTTASMLIQNGVSLFETGAILGHKDPKITQRYAHLSTDKNHENLRRVFG